MGSACTKPAKKRRELSHPGVFGVYKLFWRGSKWEKFILHDKRLIKSFLEPRPGVYEFAVSRMSSTRRFKVYIGESGSISKRHQAYTRPDSHLAQLFSIAVANRCTVWRRCKYVKTKKRAVAWEAHFLARYDYAWNAKQNMSKRAVSVVQRRFCMCMPYTIIV